MAKLPPIAYIGAIAVLGGGGFAASKVLGSKTSDVAQEYGNSANQLTVLGDTFSGYSTFRNEEFAKKIEKAGIGIRYENEFDQTKRAERLGKSADIIVTSLDQVVTHTPEGEIVGIIDKTVGADAVVLNTSQYPELKSLNDLTQLQGQDLKAVYSSDTPSEYLANLLEIKFEGFSLDDFDLVEVAESSEAYDSLNEDSGVAVAVLWEPYVSKAKQDGNTVVLSSKDVPESIVDVIVVSHDALKNDREDVEAFLATYYQHAESLNLQKKALKKQIGSDGSLNESDASNVVKGIEFFDSVTSKEWMESGKLSERIQATAGILTLTGRIGGIPGDSKSFYSSDYLGTAVANRKQTMKALALTDPNIGQKKKVEVKTVAPKKIKESKSVGNLNVRGVVTFATGSDVLTQESKVTLDQFAKGLKDFSPETTALNVVGHTSKTGSSVINKSISQKRSSAVVSYLKGKGVKLSMNSEGRGFDSLLTSVSPTDTKQQRTEIQLKRIGE